MPKWTQRLVSVGPFDNDTYRQLTKIGKANGYDSAEEFIGEMVEEIASDKDCLAWTPLAMQWDDYKFAVERFGEEDVRAMLDQLVGDALDIERVTNRIQT
jgi:hypothetical protein